MQSKTLVTVIGIILLIVLWSMFRSLIKEGSIKTETPFVFLLSSRYKHERGE